MLQKLFDTSVLGLRKQGVAAVVPGTANCRYRTPEGNKCAAGFLIPDETYTPELEGRGVTTGKNIQKAIGLTEGTGEVELVAALQRAHDGAAYRVFYEGSSFEHRSKEPVKLDQRWLEQCQEIANDFGLDDAVTTNPLPPS